MTDEEAIAVPIEVSVWSSGPEVRFDIPRLRNTLSVRLTASALDLSDADGLGSCTSIPTAVLRRALAALELAAEWRPAPWSDALLVDWLHSSGAYGVDVVHTIPHAPLYAVIDMKLCRRVVATCSSLLAAFEIANALL